eukprot:5237374-Alexandrium_andersonii.AAC.1
MSASLVGSEMCIRDRPNGGCGTECMRASDRGPTRICRSFPLPWKRSARCAGRALLGTLRRKRGLSLRRPHGANALTRS